jgi:hypothetical protein
MAMAYAKSFMEASLLLGDIHGKPLPKTMLEHGDDDRGWHITLNNTDEDFEHHPRMSIFVLWGLFPA